MSAKNIVASTSPAACCGPDCCGGDEGRRPAATGVTAAVREKYGSVARAACRPTTTACARWPRRSATRPRNWPRSPPRRTWACPAATPPPPPTCGRARWSWTWAAAAGWTCSWRPRKVGPTGKAIGIDMTPEMIDLARRNAARRPGLHERRVPPGDHRQAAAAGRLGGLRDHQLRHQPRPRQARRLPGDRPGAEAGRPAGGQRHRPEARRCRRSSGNDLMAYVGCIAGAILIEDYRRGLVEAGFAARRGHRHRGGPERLRQGREPGGVLLAAGVPEPACRRRVGLLLGPAPRGRGAARPACRPAAPVRRERLRRQREGLRREAR